MTASLIEFRDQLLALLDGDDATLPELHADDAQGRPRTLFPTTPPAGTAVGTVVWVADLTQDSDPGAKQGGAGPRYDSEFRARIRFEVEVEPDGTGRDNDRAQAAAVDLAGRGAGVIRTAVSQRYPFTSGSRRSTVVERRDVKPSLPIDDGGAVGIVDLTVLHKGSS